MALTLEDIKNKVFLTTAFVAGTAPAAYAATQDILKTAIVTALTTAVPLVVDGRVKDTKTEPTPENN